MIEFVNKYKGNIYSQNGEDCIIAECVRRLGIGKGYSVEIGGNDGFYCSNTAALLEQGWSGLFVEADWDLYQNCRENWHKNPNVRVRCATVDGQNVNELVDERCDLFSTDTDGADYKIFKGLTAKPKIAIVEIDSSLPPGDEGFNSDGAAGYRTMVQLGIDKGYFLLCHTGNCIFVLNEYRDRFPEIVGDGLTNAESYFNRSWLEAA